MKKWTLGFVMLVAGCATNPVTGKTQLMLVSESQEIEMGKGMLAQTEQETGFYADPALQSYVSTIGLGMAHASERPTLPWEYHVIDDAAINAFAAPGGYIFITRGILTYLNSEAELAAVLGHETGHVTARHSAAMVSQQELGGLGLAGLSIWKPKLGDVLNTGASLYFLNFSRNDERQADGLGHRYSLHAKYDPREMPKTFQTLQRVSNTGSSRMPGFLSTHPDPGDRVAYTKAWADAVTNFGGLAIDRDRYLSHIDGLMFGEDPEQGYFESARYLHPVLKLRFDMPSGWQGMNQRSQVVLAEPNGQAQITFSAAKGNTPDAAAQVFLAQKGMQNIGGQRLSLGGDPATLVLRGEVIFVQHGGAVYQFLGLTLATSWATLGPAISQSLRSFGPTAGNQVFHRRKYLRIVTLPRAMSVADLAAQSGGAIAVPELAIINAVSETAMLPAGARVKTVGYR